MESLNQSFFLRLFKKGQNKDKVLIAADAICSIEERKDENAVRIYTMDGFWYVVEDSIDMISDALPCKKIKRQDSNMSATDDVPRDQRFVHKGRGIRKRKFTSPAAEFKPRSPNRDISWDSQN